MTHFLDVLIQSNRDSVSTPYSMVMCIDTTLIAILAEWYVFRRMNWIFATKMSGHNFLSASYSSVSCLVRVCGWER